MLYSDIEELRRIRNKERQYFATQNEISKEMQEEWYAKYLQRDDDIMFKIVSKKEPDLFIGAIALYDIDEKQKNTSYIMYCLHNALLDKYQQH